MAHTKQAESEGGRQQALKAVQEAWKQIDDLRAEARLRTLVTDCCPPTHSSSGPQEGIRKAAVDHQSLYPSQFLGSQ